MGFSNPPVPWAEFERTLSDRRAPKPSDSSLLLRPAEEDVPHSRKRAPVTPPPAVLRSESEQHTPYIELHTHSAFSFLDGASQPQALVAEAARLGLTGLAITDHDGFTGAVRFAEAAETIPELLTVFGAELSLELSEPQMGQPDPEGSHLLVLAKGLPGYHALSAAITEAQLACDAEKGRPVYQLDQLAEQLAGQVAVLTGCRKGQLRRALASGPLQGPDAARTELRRLCERFGSEHVWVELIDHGHPSDQWQNECLIALAAEQGLGVVATNNVHYATPSDAPLAQALAAVRARRSLDEIDGWLPGGHTAHLRSGAEMLRRFARIPEAVHNSVRLGQELAFRLRSARPKLPTQQVPSGYTPMTWLRELAWRGAAESYGDPLPAGYRERIERELRVIEEKDFPGYFLIVHDLVIEAKRRGILCQGRGSAASSAVCYVLGITAVDAIKYGLPFERFLSHLRDEEPDIDVDFDSDRREEIIQYVYEKYGRRSAAQVANVITYRPKAAVRDMAKALGYSPGQQDAWSRQVERWGSIVGTDHDIPEPVVNLATQLLKSPRHLGIHSGGMVLTERPVGEVCPIEHARMPGRTVLQWDKDDCAWMGLVKFDLLGLGMLGAIAHAYELVAEHLGERWDLRTIPKEEPGVYDMLCRADAIGVFQVESRAQLATLPRLRPRAFYELATEIALIRPGPVQGDAVHPYIRRKSGREKVSYPHPKLEPVLARTLGVPVFQEQIIGIGMAIGGLDPAEADLLRRAMGSKRGIERIDSLRRKLFDGMARNGIEGAEAERMYARILAFADFGFAESHSLSFALLVYASAWLKLHYPAAFLAALLRAQPMGFYSAQTLTADARRHGVQTRRPDIVRSGVDAGLEPLDAGADPAGVRATGRDDCRLAEQPPVGEFTASDQDTARAEQDSHRRDGELVVRLGLSQVKQLGRPAAERIVRAREQAPFADLADLSRRADLNTEQLEALAAAGALASFGLSRRSALWAAGEAAVDRAEYLPGTVTVVQPPLLPLLSPQEQTVYDVWATGLSPDEHPIRHLRPALDARGVRPIRELWELESGTRAEAAGAVTHRQRPSTAGGVTFVNLEDETGLLNVVASVGFWKRYRRVARESPALIVRGIVERTDEGVLNLVADRFEALASPALPRSRDFR